ncbi:MAG: DUF983 domain-containing protein [Alphaproteobacteria bacterium]
MLTLVEACSECRIKLREQEQGDGPAFFAILLIGTLVGIFSAVVEIKYEPAFWVHAALWIPFIVIGSLLCIRLFKAMLIAAQYKWREQDFGNSN